MRNLLISKGFENCGSFVSNFFSFFHFFFYRENSNLSRVFKKAGFSTTLKKNDNENNPVFTIIRFWLNLTNVRLVQYS